MDREDRLSRVVLGLSDALVMADWPGWLRSVGELFDADKVHLAPLPSTGTIPISVFTGWELDQLRAYNEYYFRFDPLAGQLGLKPDGNAFRAADVAYSDERSRRTLFHEFLRPCGVSDFLAIPLTVDRSSRFMLGVCRDREFGPEDVALVLRLGAHLRQSLRVWQVLDRIQAVDHLYRFTLEHLATPVFILTDTLRLIYANRAGEGLIGSLFTQRADRTLAAADRRSQASLKQALARIAGHEQGQVVTTMHDPEGSQSYTVAAVRLPVSSADALTMGTEGSAIAMFVTRHVASSVEIDANSLVEVFGLSPKETRVALQLLEGSRVSDIADRLAITTEGVRHHLKQLFQKTSTHSQIELIRLLASAASPVLRHRALEAEPTA